MILCVFSWSGEISVDFILLEGNSRTPLSAICSRVRYPPSVNWARALFDLQGALSFHATIPARLACVSFNLIRSEFSKCSVG